MKQNVEVKSQDEKSSSPYTYPWLPLWLGEIMMTHNKSRVLASLFLLENAARNLLQMLTIHLLQIVNKGY